MDTKKLTQQIDKELQDFMVYVDSNYHSHDLTSVTHSDLYEYSNQITGLISGIEKCITDFLNQQ